MRIHALEDRISDVSVKLGVKKYRGRIIRGTRLYLQWRDKEQRWREMLPFYISSNKAENMAMIKLAHQYIRARKKDYVALLDARKKAVEIINKSQKGKLPEIETSIEKALMEAR